MGPVANRLPAERLRGFDPSIFRHPRKTMSKRRHGRPHRISEAQDDRLDRKLGIKENSPQDMRRDRAAGLPADPDTGMMGPSMMGYRMGGKVCMSCGGKVYANGGMVCRSCGETESGYLSPMNSSGMSKGYRK